ncbi:M81 family metallopeptidase [Phyllobacterium myrsinacearum]|uniref:Microcystinase C n=1 Tax=Phyllobacterium myrsinacearum TaxID=28101 RepID=A0A839EWU8_9HYPH|nr:microcystin degradation protein MlrC [Phyllobacterium myrsinacearum]
MKLFIAGLDTETNTFSPIPTGYEAFRENLIAHGDATSKPLNCCSSQLHVWTNAASARGWNVVESLCAVAEPGGTTTRATYEAFRDEILNDLRAAMPVDGVLLALHGACVADGYDDVEGDLLSHVRKIVGPDIPVGAELDLHCHLTKTMLDNATMLVAYKEYPHTDIEERADHIFQLLVQILEGKCQPVMAEFDCRMIGTFRVHEQPLRGLVDRMKALEGQNGILSVSFCHGFPWGDVADVGARMLVIADRDINKAQQLAASFGQEIFALRDRLKPSHSSIDEALDEALDTSGTVVLADVSDNAGGGAPGDSTFVLRRVIERGIKDVATCLYWDPIAVRLCHEAGEGAVLPLRIGGKIGPASGQPIDLTVTVRKLASGITQRFGIVPLSIGDAAWVSVNGVDIVLNSLRTQTFHPECMTGLGLDPAQRKIVIVKSSNHFRAGFEPIASKILYISAPGALQPHFENVPYTKLKSSYWPKVKNPFAGAPV